MNKHGYGPSLSQQQSHALIDNFDKDFDAKRKSGKQIVDYFSSLGKEGIELFVNEAKNRNFYGRPFNYESNLETPKDPFTLG